MEADVLDDSEELAVWTRKSLSVAATAAVSKSKKKAQKKTVVNTKTMKPQKMKAYGSFAEWKRDQSTRNQSLITALSGLVRRTAPEFTATVKWGQGCFTSGEVPKAYIHAEPDHVQFGFYAGAKLKDPEGLLVGAGKYVRHVKVFTTKGIPRAALVAFIEQVL